MMTIYVPPVTQIISKQMEMETETLNMMKFQPHL